MQKFKDVNLKFVFYHTLHTVWYLKSTEIKVNYDE